MMVCRETDRMMVFREREKAKASNGLLYFGHRPKENSSSKTISQRL